MWFTLFLTVCLFLQTTAVSTDRYVVIIDAGSTGSRAYSFKIAAEGPKRVTTLRRTSGEGGLATYIKNPSEAKSCVLSMIVKVAAFIPKEFWRTTEFSVRATGGMRTLSAEDQAVVWQGLIDGLKADPLMPFVVNPKNFGTITGDKEAYYAVLSANYIADRIDDKLMPIPGTQLIGALDMGGSSTQMIYHLGSEAAEEDDFWGYSWTSYGASSARERVWANIIQHHLAEASTAPTVEIVSSTDGETRERPTVVHHIPNPCAYRGHVEETEHLHSAFGSDLEDGTPSSVKVVLTGVGDPVQCGKFIKRTLWNDTDTHASCLRRSPVDELSDVDSWNEHNCCLHEDTEGSEDDRMACSLNSVALPHAPSKFEFYAMSAYFFAFDCIRELGTYELANWPSPSISELDAAIHSFCEEHHWDQISDKFGKHQYTTDRQIALRCFESLYLITVLKHAFGFPGSFRGINFAPGLNTGGFSAVDWPLGYLLTQNAAREEVAAALEELNERTE